VTRPRLEGGLERGGGLGGAVVVVEEQGADGRVGERRGGVGLEGLFVVGPGGGGITPARGEVAKGDVAGGGAPRVALEEEARVVAELGLVLVAEAGRVVGDAVDARSGEAEVSGVALGLDALGAAVGDDGLGVPAFGEGAIAAGEVRGGGAHEAVAQAHPEVGAERDAEDEDREEDGRGRPFH
jgi:hypothetical protein